MTRSGFLCEMENSSGVNSDTFLLVLFFFFFFFFFLSCCGEEKQVSLTAVEDMDVVVPNRVARASEDHDLVSKGHPGVVAPGHWGLPLHLHIGPGRSLCKTKEESKQVIILNDQEE